MFNRRAGCLGNPLVRFCEGLGGNRETGAALPTRLLMVVLQKIFRVKEGL